MEKETKTVALGDHVLVRKIGESDRMVDGIIVTGSQQSLLSKAEVLSVGDGEKVEKLHLQKGEVIYYNEIENNCVAADGTQNLSYFIRYDFIYGKEVSE